MEYNHGVCPGKLQEAADRVVRMESLFDRLSEALGECPDLPISEEEFRRDRMILSEYLESGDWLRDFELDEAGLLPKGLKRGVLSEDGLYDLLSTLDGED